MRRTLSSILGLGIAGIIGISSVVKAEDLMENIPMPLSQEQVESVPFDESRDEATFSRPVYNIPVGPLYEVTGSTVYSLPSIAGLKPLEFFSGKKFVEEYSSLERNFQLIYCANGSSGKFVPTNRWNFTQTPKAYAERVEDKTFKVYTISGENLSGCDFSKKEEKPKNPSI